MIAKTEAEWNPDYADISYGVDPMKKEAQMDSDRIDVAIEWITNHQTLFLGSTGWKIPQPNDYKKGGFGVIFFVSHPVHGSCVIKLVSLVELFDLGCIKTDDAQGLLEQVRNDVDEKLSYLTEKTRNGKASKLCKIEKYAFIPYGNGDPDLSTGVYSRVLADYIICTKMERLQEIDYCREFCDNGNELKEERLIDFGISVCDSLIQLGKYNHRDLHPKNFMQSLGENRTFKLIDFDTMLEKDQNAPHLDYVYVAKFDDPSSEPLPYKSKEAKSRYDIYDDIYSAGCILYDIANYNYLENCFRSPRLYGEDGMLVKPDNISEDFFCIISKACSETYRERYSRWEDFKKDLEDIKDIWRKFQCIKKVPDTYEIWKCRKDSVMAVMRRIPMGNTILIREYDNRKNIFNRIRLRDVNIRFPKMLAEYNKDGYKYYIEEQPPETSLITYISSKAILDNSYYVFIRRFISNYIKLLSIKDRPMHSQKLVTYRNLMTMDSIYVVNNEDIWINGLAIPENEYRDYIAQSRLQNYIIESKDYKVDNETIAVYSLGVILREMLSSCLEVDRDFEDNCNIISREKRGRLIDLMNACLSASEEHYTIKDIEKYMDGIR